MDWALRLYAAQAVLTAAFCVLIAALRGRSVTAWLVAGLVLGPLGLAALVLTDPAARAVLVPFRREPSRCPRCGAEVDPARESACSSCGMPLAA